MLLLMLRILQIQSVCVCMYLCMLQWKRICVCVYVHIKPPNFSIIHPKGKMAAAAAAARLWRHRCRWLWRVSSSASGIGNGTSVRSLSWITRPQHTTAHDHSDRSSTTTSNVGMNGVTRGLLTVSKLRELAEQGIIDTVVVGFTDCYGRLMGKRYTANFFLESAVEDGVHSCSYLLATDVNMEPVQGYKFASWELGYGDIHLVPQLDTLRLASWLEKTAVVLCDVVGGKDNELAPHAPRSILRNQINMAEDWVAMGASELEYYMYHDGFEKAKDKNYTNLKPGGWIREDYHILQGTREEFFHGQARRHLEASGVPVENSKGEYGHGQHELNVKYAEVLEMADRHIIYKQCLKELAESLGVSVTFMAKPHTSQPGSSCHIHLSLWKNGQNIFTGTNKLDSISCSNEFRWFLGGWMKHTPDMMVFYAPNVNSYKRYCIGSFAPTQIAWSLDNRTAPFRVLGSGKSLRIECRLPGADCNPYLAFAAALASGLDGIRNRIEPPPAVKGNVYLEKDLPRIPQSLGRAVSVFKDSDFAKQMLGSDVHHHYTHFFETEDAAFTQAVTDWEKVRYFQQI